MDDSEHILIKRTYHFLIKINELFSSIEILDKPMQKKEKKNKASLYFSLTYNHKQFIIFIMYLFAVRYSPHLFYYPSVILFFSLLSAAARVSFPLKDYLSLIETNIVLIYCLLK